MYNLMWYQKFKTYICMYFQLTLNQKQNKQNKIYVPQKEHDRDRTRTCNPQIRSLVPYPLGHTATVKIDG